MKNVLVVEDDAHVREALASILSYDLGCEVVRAENGLEALESLAGARPDLIITDFMMPVMDGADFAKAVRKKQGYAAVPILMLSALPSEFAQQHGTVFNKWLRKPIEIRVLLEAVEHLLSPPRRHTLGDATGSTRRI